MCSVLLQGLPRQTCGNDWDIFMLMVRKVICFHFCRFPWSLCTFQPSRSTCTTSFGCCSYAEAERSFSALRTLKTWLRSTMLQIHINNTAVCHIHKEILDKVSQENVCQEFIMANEYRKHVFGSFMWEEETGQKGG